MKNREHLAARLRNSVSGQTFATLGVVLCFLASCALSVLPLYSLGGSSGTLPRVNGWQGVVALLLPAVVSLLGLAESKGLRILAGSALLAFGFLTAIGVYYLPAAVLMIAAAYRTARGTIDHGSVVPR